MLDVSGVYKDIVTAVLMFPADHSYFSVNL
jgi:hypothetical protein